MASSGSSGGGKKPETLANGSWANLPAEILGSIVERLTVLDSLRFAAVCTSWASAAPPKNNGLYLPLAPHFPFLLLRHHSRGFFIYSLLDNRSHRIPPFSFALDEFALPEIPGTRFFGAQHGWFILHDDAGNWSLLNPITKARIQLPLLSPSHGHIAKFVITPTPASSSYAAVAVNWNRLFFTRAGDDAWTPFLAEAQRRFEDAVYHNNRFLVLTRDGRVHAIDPTAARVEKTLLADGPPLEFKSHLLVKSMDDLLLVTRKINSSGETTGIEVRRLDPGTGRWVPVKSLADRSLFLGDCWSWSMSVSAQDVPGLKPNCVYFRESGVYDGKQYVWNVQVYNLEDGRRKTFHPPKWLARNLKLQQTIWFTPALQ